MIAIGEARQMATLKQLWDLQIFYSDPAEMGSFIFGLCGIT